VTLRLQALQQRLELALARFRNAAERVDDGPAPLASTEVRDLAAKGIDVYLHREVDEDAELARGPTRERTQAAGELRVDRA
jgi:hypothetical protein